MSDFNFDEPVTAVAKKSIFAKIAGLSAKVKIATAAGLVVLVGGGGAFAYSALNSPDAVVGLALASVFGEAHPSFEVSADVKSASLNGSGSLDVYTADAGSLLSIKASADVSGQAVGATLNVLGSKSGDVYLNLADFDSLGAYLITSGLLPMETVNNARTVLNGAWVKVTKEELDTYGALVGDSNSCISNKLNNPEYTKKVQGEFVTILRNNNFIQVKKELPGVNGDRVFELGINADHLKSFLKAVKASTYYADVSTCVPTLNISDAQIESVNQASIDDALKNETTTLYANSFSHKLDKIEFQLTDGTANQNVKLTFKALGDQSSKVVVPAKSTTLTELLTTLSTPSY